MTESAGIPIHRWHELPDPSGSFQIESWGHRKQDLATLHPHRHEYHEIMCFTNGTFVHDIDFISFESAGNEFHFVQANSVHMMVREEDASGISLMFSSDFADQQVLQLLPFGTANPVIKSDSSLYQQNLQLLQLIQSEYTNQAPGYLQIIRNYFNGFLWQLARIYQPTGNEHKKSTPELYKKFITLLQKNPTQWRTVESVADALHVTPKHLIEIVKNHSGQTPLQLIHDHLLTETKRLLFHTDQPIKEIAYSMGFTDSTNFSKWFRSKTGYTPGAYRIAEGK
jgi:AraC-like DNA-binding protein